MGILERDRITFWIGRYNLLILWPKINWDSKFKGLYMHSQICSYTEGYYWRGPAYTIRLLGFGIAWGKDHIYNPNRVWEDKDVS